MGKGEATTYKTYGIIFICELLSTETDGGEI
jgi:hypothetical protein